MLPRQASPELIRQRAFEVAVEGQTLDEIEKQAIVRALLTSPSKQQAALLLGITRKGLYLKMQRHGLWPEKKV